MFSLELRAEPNVRDMLTAELWDAGSVGIVELDDARVRAFFDDAAGPEALVERFAAYDPRARKEEERDWVAYSREKWEPILAGERFFLVPEWLDDPAPEGRFRIEVNPGMAFGTGVHETTQLCIEALERHVRPGLTVLDVGTGSGILSQAAELLGAARVVACDNDHIAVEIARANLRNGLVFTGSADALAPRSADLLVANISPEAAMALAPEFLRCLRPNGVAMLSGFELNEIGMVRAALPGGTVKDARTKGNWALVEWQPAPTGTPAPAVRS
ncbi:MAG TPA: 50S ribosomal protein L11 methyltransferase [Bryobacteraceae bacterium]|nr:50S ribosomal protein L11 methyltransferase [Bryobacteraceae bacterium]